MPEDQQRALRGLHQTNNQPPSAIEGKVLMESITSRSTSAVEHISTLFEYTIWARDLLLGVIKKLDEDAQRKAPKGGVYGSIYDTLSHLDVSEWLWIRRCLGESPTRLPGSEDFASMRVLIDWWNQAHADATSYLGSLTDADLEQEVTYTAPDGKTRTRKVWHMLLQVVNHQTEHRSQIATMLGQMELEVPQMDLVVFLR